jgi:hypothetical protein
MKQFIFLFGVIFISYINAVYAQSDTIYTFGEDIITEEYYFGVNLKPGFNGLIHMGIVKIENGKKNITFLTKDDFIYQITGKQRSRANPNKENLMEKHEINNWLIVEELWKLRYSEYPYETGTKMDEGWSRELLMPSEAQFEMLREFGFTKITDFIYGENLFKLFKALDDSEWVTKYKDQE